MTPDALWTQILACATCVGAPGSKSDLNFVWSALVLVPVPIVVAGAIAGVLYYAHRRAARPPSPSRTPLERGKESPS